MSDDGGGADGADGGPPPLPALGWTASEEGISFYFVVSLSLLAFVLVMSKLLHDRPSLSSFLPEAGMTILVGVAAGYVVYLLAPPGSVNEDADADDDSADGSVVDGLLSFSPTVFFVALLPPIIFNSGYSLKRELFFRHMHPIVLFACLGTAMSALVVAALLQLVTAAGLTGDFTPRFSELLTFGALISATDPVSTLAVFQAKRVDPQLFYLVFGESVLNDAVGLVLFNACQKFVGNEDSLVRIALALMKFVLDFLTSFVGSLALGFLSGILAALLLKKVDMRGTGMVEVSLYIMVMYLPFFFAEVLHLSGIVTILFTGISAKRYAEPNLSEAAADQSDALFRVTAHLAETAIFLELGLSVFGLASYGNFYWRFVLWAVLACLVGRACNIYPIAALYNRSLWGGEADGSGGEKAAAAAGGGKGEGLRVGDLEMIRSAGRSGDDDGGDGRRGSDSSKEGGRQMHRAISPVGSTSSAGTMTPRSHQDLKIDWGTANMLWFSGLRGAVAYACAKTFPNVYGNRMAFIITTMVIVLITVFLLGGTTALVLESLNIAVDVDEDEYMRNEYDGAQQDRLNFGYLGMFEEKYICPYVIRDYNAADSDDAKDGGATTDGGAAAAHASAASSSRPSLATAFRHGSSSFRTGYSPHTPSPYASFYAGGHVEVTTTSHFDLMRRMGHVSEDAYRRKRSLYDYGR